MDVKPFVSLIDIPLQEASDIPKQKGLAKRFERSQASVSAMLGAQKLGYNITVVPPGKAAFPAHNHHVNEEMFLILEGSAQLRVGAASYSVSAMDIIACPPGGPESAHQLINTGDTDLRYLAVSTREYPEVCDYPDSNKIGIYHNRKDAQGNDDRRGIVVRESDSRDYWEGE